MPANTDDRSVLTVALLLPVVLLAGTSGGGGDAAMEELRAAYARGDLTDEEFERRRERLRREE